MNITEKNGVYEYDVYPGIEDILSQMYHNEVKMYVVTTKPEYAAKQMLADCRLTNYFNFIGGDNMDLTRSAKTDVIRYVLSENHIVTGSNIVMIGDRKYDISAAKTTGLDSIGVLMGMEIGRN